MPTLPTYLRAWRKRLGLTQAEAAEKLGVGARTYHGWEKGGPCPGEVMLRLACERIELREAGI